MNWVTLLKESFYTINYVTDDGRYENKKTDYKERKHKKRGCLIRSKLVTMHLCTVIIGLESFSKGKDHSFFNLLLITV